MESASSTETLAFGLVDGDTSPDGYPIGEYVPDYHDLVPYVPKKRRAMSKRDIAKALAIAVPTVTFKRTDAVKFLDSLAAIGTKEIVNVGKFTLPGLVMIRTRVKPAAKAVKKMLFGMEVDMKVTPAKTVVKAFPTQRLKKSI